jgi:hypothetical protein
MILNKKKMNEKKFKKKKKKLSKLERYDKQTILIKNC